MVKDPNVTLGIFRLKRIEVFCPTCSRRGFYDRDRAIERHGADCTMFNFFQAVANCSNPRCLVGCPDLLYMFMDVREVKQKWEY
ncbi:hypothetical protein [Rhizobium sp. Root1220]|uniref:hypothetical protein n=1 Tax=Rhizobium sp. Root1220 TaxID=1736432 RepID=UPI0007008451|nr:hypothetical protein [Rhizobium sp. Root1220]KQV83213.1 hypothetical protein ASC90_21715 [Rhizobium sp. Root1220]